MEYVVVRISARVTPRILIENNEITDGAHIKKIMKYETLFPPEVIKVVEKELRLIVKRVKDKIHRLAPLRIANLELFSVNKVEKIVEILEDGKKAYWDKIKMFANQFNVDIERLEMSLYFRYNMFRVQLPEGLVQLSAVETVLNEIKGLREFLEKYNVPETHITTLKKAEELIEDDLPDDLRDAVLKIMSIALNENGKVKQRARTFLKKLIERIGRDAPIVALLSELIELQDPNEAIRRISDVIARSKYVKKIESLEAQISGLRDALARAEIEKKKIIEDARKRINELNKKIEELSREKEKLEQEKDEHIRNKIKELNLELDEIDLEIKNLRELGKKTQDLNILQDIDQLEIRIDNLKRKERKKINIEI